MNGETPLIIKDLKLGLSIKETSLKYQKSECNIRAIAKRHNLVIKNSKQSEKEERMRRNRERYNSEERMGRGAMPQQPYKAAKYGGLGKLNEAWALKKGLTRSSNSERIRDNQKYGLRFPV